MASVTDALAQAWQAHQGGDHRRAALLCLEVLRTEAAQPAALALLGGICLAIGDFAEAAPHYERALRSWPEDAGCHNGLGVALLRQGRLEDALPHFREAIRLAPQSPEAFNNMAMALRLHGQLDEARDCLGQALRLLPGSPDAHFNLGLVLQTQGKLDEAAASYREALRLRPDYAEAHCALGTRLKDVGQLEEAEAHFRRAVELRSDWAEPLHLLGLVLQARGQLAESETALRQVTRLSPDHLAYSNLGVTLAMQGQSEEAVANFRHALRLNPDYLDGYVNLGNLLPEVGVIDEADATLQQAIRLRPDCATAHRGLGFVALLQGDFQRGWSELERAWQLETGLPSRRDAEEPLWDGADLRGRTILLYSEHAHGDTLQFIRYASLVKERGATVLLECQPRLVRLLASCAGIDRIFAAGSPLPPYDVQTPLMRLPGVFGTTLETVPNKVPYLSAEAGLVEVWRRELAPLEGFKIGIAWQGDPRYRTDLRRSIPLERFAPLALLNGARLVSLQKGVGRESLPAFASRFPIIDLGDRLDETSGGFVDTAAVMTNLDLVITSDTGLAHLAGALGVPVWVALASVPDWRFLLKREDSPWYPTMRLFRQARRGDWDGVFERMAAEVRGLLEEKADADVIARTADLPRADGSDALADYQLSQLVAGLDVAMLPGSLGDRADRRETTRCFLGYLKGKHEPLVVETGCQRAENDFGAGMSTTIFGLFLRHHGGRLISLDNSSRNVAFARGVVARAGLPVAIHEADSRQALASVPGVIDALYLDSADVGTPDFAECCLEEARVALPRLASDAVVMIDDSPRSGEAWIGKGRLAIPWLIAQGFEVVAQGYQTLLRRPLRPDPAR